MTDALRAPRPRVRCRRSDPRRLRGFGSAGVIGIASLTSFADSPRHADAVARTIRAAGSVTAAKILEHFVGDAKWAHLDIAGTSYVDSKKPYQEKGATGMAVRTLAELAMRMVK